MNKVTNIRIGFALAVIGAICLDCDGPWTGSVLLILGLILILWNTDWP